MSHPDPFLAVLERIASALERQNPPSQAEKFENLIRAERAAGLSGGTDTNAEEAPEAQQKKGSRK